MILVTVRVAFVAVGVVVYVSLYTKSTTNILVQGNGW